MGDQVCKEACDEAFKDGITGCYGLLADCLLTAADEEEKAGCKAASVSCMELNKQASNICMDECQKL